jgi:hypothetical protein
LPPDLGSCCLVERCQAGGELVGEHLEGEGKAVELGLFPVESDLDASGGLKPARAQRLIVYALGEAVRVAADGAVAVLDGVGGELGELAQRVHAQAMERLAVAEGQRDGF